MHRCDHRPFENKNFSKKITRKKDVLTHLEQGRNYYRPDIKTICISLPHIPNVHLTPTLSGTIIVKMLMALAARSARLIFPAARA